MSFEFEVVDFSRSLERFDYFRSAIGVKATTVVARNNSSHSAALPSGPHALIVEAASSGVAKRSERKLARANARPVQSIFLYLRALTSPALSSTVPLLCNRYYS